MISIPGQSGSTCDGFSRREFLRIGGMGMALFTGHILETTHGYALLFAICASAYFVALVAIQLLSPRLARVDTADILPAA